MNNTLKLKKVRTQKYPISPALRNKGAVVALIGLGLIVFLLMMVSYQTQSLFYAWDQPVINYFREYRQIAPEWLTTTARVVGKAGSEGITAVTIILLFIWALQRKGRRFFLLFATVVGVELLWLPLVFSFGRPRPTEVRTVFDIVLPGFPSGHVMIYIAFFGALTYLYFAKIRSKSRRFLVVALLLLLLILTGWIRLYFSAHYVTDVIAGYGIGLAWTVAALTAVDWYFFRIQHKEWEGSRE